MVTVPAFVWRGGFFRRAVTIGPPVGIALGALGWIDSGSLLSGVAVTVVLGVFYGIWISRRMARYWPGAKHLSGEDRVTVVRTVRRGDSIGDPRLAQAVIDYGSGLRAAAEKARPFRWVLVFVLVVSVLITAWDAVYGSWGNLVASAIYLVLLLIDLLWWPKARRRLLANAEQSASAVGS